MATKQNVESLFPGWGLVAGNPDLSGLVVHRLPRIGGDDVDAAIAEMLLKVGIQAQSLPGMARADVTLGDFMAAYIAGVYVNDDQVWHENVLRRGMKACHSRVNSGSFQENGRVLVC
jgi:hypothetical protein